jgi:hypothetical protein
MNAKEKAKELTDKMWIYSMPNANGSWNNAKQCALICVQETIDAFNRLEDYVSIVYWELVKKEIELL